MRGPRSIFEYDNFRAYLKDFYASAKAENPKFSFRFFSRLAGFQSPSFLKHVMDSKRNLSEESIEKLAKAMKLNKEQSEFFKNLVFLNQSTTVQQKQRYSREILRSKGYRKMYPLKEAEINCLSQWYYIPIREMVGLPGFREDAAWIASHLSPRIAPSEAQKAIDDLLKSGLLVRDAQGGLQQANRVIGVPDAVTLSSLAHCHKELIKRAGESIDLIPREEREIGAVTLRLSSQNIQKIKEKIQTLRNEIVELASEENIPDAIYQWNFQLFPLAHLKKDKEGIS